MAIDNELINYFLSRAKRGVDPSNLNPMFAQRLQQAISAAEAATGSQARITDLYRPPERQAQYYANYTQRPVTYGGHTYNPQQPGGLAAAPGRSRHGIGQGADIARGPTLDWLHAHAPDYGLEFLSGRAFKRDPVHIQLARGTTPQMAQQVATTAAPPIPEPRPDQLGATPQTPPQPDAAQQAQLAQAAGAEPATAQQAQLPTQQPVDPMRSLFDRILEPYAKREGDHPGFLSQMAGNAGAPKGSIGLLGKLLMAAGSLGGSAPPPLPVDDTADNVPREDASSAMQRGQMAQAMIQPQQAPVVANQPDPNTPPPDPQTQAGLTPEQLEELRRKGLGSMLGFA